MLDLINDHRIASGKAALAWQDQLGEAAQEHSDDMVAHNYSSHTGFDGSSPRDRMVAAGYTPAWWGENINENPPGDPSAQSAFQAWVNSPDHNANMLNANYIHIGIGQATTGSGITRWTVVFGAPLG